MSRKQHGPATVTLNRLPWPFTLFCDECGWPARAYPFPVFEDLDLFEDPEELSAGATIGTVWCPRCDPPWGEFLLQQMTIWAARTRPGTRPIEPALPLLGGYPAEAIGFLESELSDFLDGPGPMSAPGGEGVAPRSEPFLWACADLVAWMRDARRIGYLTFARRSA
jgi:hypothetical protein